MPILAGVFDDQRGASSFRSRSDNNPGHRQLLALTVKNNLDPRKLEQNAVNAVRCIKRHLKTLLQAMRMATPTMNPAESKP